jgi:lipopolysaccharide biosynthesis protein
MDGFSVASACHEDAELGLKVRAEGYALIYEPSAVMARCCVDSSESIDVTVDTERRPSARDRQAVPERAVALDASQLRLLAFYLPQYHPIPENDLWWGKGFTDWVNLKRARPNYEGHLQPRIPADLGYYDLRHLDVMEAQAALARQHGLSGFCYYYYNFDGKRLLETPLEQMLAAGRPDLPFCLCWANENWTRRWDGRSKDVLMAQSYSHESMRIIISDMLRYCASPHYIRLNGKPLILIYRVSELPDPKHVISTWREVARQTGFDDIVIANVESFELSSKPVDPMIFGCDISVEFPPHDMMQSPPLNVVRTNPDWTGTVHDYRELAINYMTREEAGFKRLRTVLAGWDNTPRYRDRSMILEKATPGAFQAWLEWAIFRTLEQNVGEERLVFINAWNEWCEGSYLEPDSHFGHAYLQAVENALRNVRAKGFCV